MRSQLNTFPKKGMKPEKAYEQVCTELALDGNINMDLGSFTSVAMDAFAQKLIMDQLGKNTIDHSEYVQSKVIHDRVVKILGSLYNGDHEKCEGTATLGSSEGIHLALLAHKWYWKKIRRSDANGIPNIVCAENVHVSWDKFALYFDVELRKIPFKNGKYPIDDIISSIDANTICVGAVAGCTYLGSIDSISLLNERLKKVNKKNNWDIGIHVDAAIAGFILPFLNNKIVWDFRLPLVRSINVSGHKFGMVYPGIGWLLFSDSEFISSELVLTSHYLTKPIETYSLNFSKSASMILAQYYAILSFGENGFKEKIQNYSNTAVVIRQLLSESGHADIADDGVLPIVVFRFNAKSKIDVIRFTEILRTKNWMLPAYQLPGDNESIYMRIVVKQNINPVIAMMLCRDIIETAQNLSI